MIPADCSHRVRDPIWVGFDSQLTGITSPVTTVSWDHKVSDSSQLAVITTFVIPADCSHRVCDPSQLAVKSNPNGITNPVTAASWDHKPCDCSQLESQKVVLQSLPATADRKLARGSYRLNVGCGETGDG